MFMWEYITWWYGAGWQRLASNIIRRIKRTYLGFSVPILLRTLFEPWRRIISTDTQSLANKLRSYVDNLISRIVGLCVRILALIAAGSLILVTALVGSILVILWPLMPVAAIGLIIWGVIK
jgi:hypothetical protein